MGPILNYAPMMIAFLVFFVFFRKWGVVRDHGGSPDRTHTHLRTLQFLSWLSVILAVVFSVAETVEGTKGGPGALVLLLAGMLGLQSWQVVSALMKRLEALEAGGAIVVAGQKTASTEGKP